MKKLIILGCMLLTTAANAGTHEGKVTYTQMSYQSGVFYFRVETQTQGYASCASNKKYAASLSTNGGKGVMSFILSAKATNQDIVVVGNKTCNAMSGAEDVWYVESK